MVKELTEYMLERPCRINTYGNSFTQCHQVSDSETWQEYLAGHLGEPIQNFGMGGFGIYQAYRRLLRREKVDKNSKYVILLHVGDDYVGVFLDAGMLLIIKVGMIMEEQCFMAIFGVILKWISKKVNWSKKKIG